LSQSKLAGSLLLACFGGGYGRDEVCRAGIMGATNKECLMTRNSLFFCALPVFCVLAFGSAPGGDPAASARATPAILAPTPPMGWNSWDSYGTTITEDDVRANAKWIAENLKSYGWQYVVIDMEWFAINPKASGNSKTTQLSMDEFGRYTPDVNRFPSSANGAGFKPLADYVHSLGLKFGLHMVRGIPRQAVENNLAIFDSKNNDSTNKDSSFHAADAADTSDACPWNSDNWGLDPAKPAAQAYYDSIAKLYASWGADFVKADCIASRPYRGEEIRMLSTALRKTGRPIVLSLSPGAAPLDKVDEMRQYADMWRISDDVWDMWHSDVPYPQGFGDQFPRVAAWDPLTQPGRWPDADMLPFGYLGPAPGYGEPRQTKLTHDEQRSFFTLWCMFRSPLMWGGNPTKSDAWTVSLLTNPEVLDVDQHSMDNHAVITTDKTVVWTAKNSRGGSIGGGVIWNHYVAVFNLQDSPQTAHFSWKDLSFPEGTFAVRDLWEHKDLPRATSLEVTLPPHGCVLYRVTVP
jgi:alpha-galactosidase